MPIMRQTVFMAILKSKSPYLVCACVCMCVMFSLSPSSAGEDYTDIGTQVLVFDRDREFYDIMVPIIDNDIHELDEEFTASLSTEESSAILTLNPDNTVVRILDDEGT